MKRLSRAATVAACMGLASAAGAAEVALDLGYDDALGRLGAGAPVAGVELRSDPLGAVGPVRFGFGAAAEVDGDGDLWAGGGLFGHAPLGRRVRLEASLMAGLYAAGAEGTRLGFPVEYRSRIGVSRAVGRLWRAGLAFEHKSNAGADGRNPGVETVFATLSRGF